MHIIQPQLMQALEGNIEAERGGVVLNTSVTGIWVSLPRSHIDMLSVGVALRGSKCVGAVIHVQEFAQWRACPR